MRALLYNSTWDESEKGSKYWSEVVLLSCRGQRAIILILPNTGQGQGLTAGIEHSRVRIVHPFLWLFPSEWIHFGPESSGKSNFIDTFQLLLYSSYCFLVCPQAQPTQICPSPMPRKLVENMTAHYVEKTVPFSQDCDTALFQDYVTQAAPWGCAV